MLVCGAHDRLHLLEACGRYRGRCVTLLGLAPVRRIGVAIQRDVFVGSEDPLRTHGLAPGGQGGIEVGRAHVRRCGHGRAPDKTAGRVKRRRRNTRLLVVHAPRCPPPGASAGLWHVRKAPASRSARSVAHLLVRRQARRPSAAHGCNFAVASEEESRSNATCLEVAPEPLNAGPRLTEHREYLDKGEVDA